MSDINSFKGKIINNRWYLVPDENYRPQPNEIIDDKYRERYATPKVYKSRPIDIPREIIKNCQYCNREVSVNPAGEKTVCPDCTHPINHGEIK